MAMMQVLLATSTLSSCYRASLRVRHVPSHSTSRLAFAFTSPAQRLANRATRSSTAFFSTSANSIASTSLEITSDWTEHPDLKKTLHFPTWIVPSEHCQAILRSPVLKRYLGHVEHVHPRIKLVRSHDEKHVLVLRQATTTPGSPEKSLTNTEQSPSQHENLTLTDDAVAMLQSYNVSLESGPTVSIPLTHKDWTVPYILHTLLPVDIHPPPTAMEQVGHVAHLNLKPWHTPYAALIGSVLVECMPMIKTVVNKIGTVHGDFRTYDMVVVAGRNDTNVILNEHGLKLSFDLSKVYWCSRLSGERKYMVDHVFSKRQIICDPFCGVGAQVLLAARDLKCSILANDWNPNAVAALRKNVQRAKLEPYFFSNESLRKATGKPCLKSIDKATGCVSCCDATEFLIDIGLSEGTPRPHHVIMNYPLESPKFLSALRWWPVISNLKYDTIFHLYTFSRPDDTTQRSVEQVAVDCVVDHLLPQGGAMERSTLRGAELNALGCNVMTRIIRDVAPGKVVVCVSFTLTKRLLKHIHSDFM